MKMGLFDKFFGRPDDNDLKDEITRRTTNNISKPSIVSRAIAEREYNLDKAIMISFTEATLESGALMQLVPTLKTLVSGNKIGNGSLVRVAFPAGVKGKLAIDKQGLTLGGILKDGGGLAQARLTAIDPVTFATQAAMAAILVEVNKKLDSIQKMQQSILDFLEHDKQAEQQGNLNVLTEILEGYQHNWDNSQYLQNHHMKVLDIKQAAEKNLVFYQEQIAGLIRKLPALHLNQMAKEAIMNLSQQFSNYRMSLYLFSFASFLEIMLSGAFNEAYLEHVASKVEQYNQSYYNQFLECHELLKKFSSESVEMKILEGLGNAGKALGKFIGSVPAFAQGSVDEWLQENGEMLLQETNKKVGKTMELFSKEEKTGSEIFADSIRNVSKICHQTTDILFDGKSLYLATA